MLCQVCFHIIQQQPSPVLPIRIRNERGENVLAGYEVVLSLVAEVRF
jgi:hypothetical protein